MQIHELKQKADILTIAAQLGIQVHPRTLRANCPFHHDKTPSLQFSKEKQIATCFSSNCTAGTMDVISLVEKKLNVNTHQALLYLQQNTGISSGQPKTKTNTSKANTNYEKDFQQMQSSFLASPTARRYAESRCLDHQKLEIGYNPYKNSKFSYLKGCITFALKDVDGKVVSLYGRSINDKSGSKHFYTANRQGLYPSYPSVAGHGPPVESQKLILTESVIDAATLLSIPEINTNYQILALYGTNGLTAEHVQAIQQLEELKEAILWLDGDEAGKAATEKQGKYLSELFQDKKITVVPTLEGEDINSLAQSHDPAIFTELLSQRSDFFFSEEEKEKINEDEMNKPAKPATRNQEQGTKQGLIIQSAGTNIIFTTATANYYIKGGIRKPASRTGWELDSMKVTLVIEHPETNAKSRNKLDLYEDKQTEKVAREAAEKLNLRADLIEHDLQTLTDLLDEYREQQMQEKEPESPKEQPLTPAEWKQYTAFGKDKNLMEKINLKIGQAGIVGEEKSRLFLFAGAVSHLMPRPLNIVVQGSSGSGKSYLIRQVSQLVPQAKVKRYTRLSEKSFYNFGEYDLCHRLVIIEDYDGMNEEVEYAFRELQSNGELVSAVSGKEHEHSDIQTKDKIVRGPIASMVATTKGDIYHDNSTRVFFLAVDESPEQTQKIIDYKNQKANREIKEADELSAKNYLQGFVKTLKSYPVKNPYLKHIQLPVPPDQLRRVHELLESFCTQITLIHQHQRQQTNAGELIADKQDMQIAIELMFDSIILKIDELDGSLRDFYEKLKSYVLSRGKEYLFMQREIRQALQMSKTHCFRNISQLEALEYIRKTGYGSHGATTYRIIYWDDNQAFRQKIKADLQKQMERF